jgi:hypothetical protein
MDQLKEEAQRYMREEVWTKWKSVKADRHRLSYDLQNKIEEEYVRTAMAEETEEFRKLSAIERPKLRKELEELKEREQAIEKRLMEICRAEESYLARRRATKPKVWESFFDGWKRHKQG